MATSIFKLLILTIFIAPFGYGQDQDSAQEGTTTTSSESGASPAPSAQVSVDPFAPVDLSKFEVKENEPPPGLGAGGAEAAPVTSASDPFRSLSDKEISQSELTLEELARQEQKEIEELKNQRRTELLRNAVDKKMREKEACKKSLDECLKEETLERKDELLKD